MAVSLWAVSLPLRVAWQAAIAGGANFLLGGLFGLWLAGITRTRHAALIYLWLGLAFLTLWPLFESWPLRDMEAPSSYARYYLTLLRVCLFVLGLPYPFARFGQHGPDTLPEQIQKQLQPEKTRTAETEEPNERAC